MHNSSNCLPYRDPFEIFPRGFTKMCSIWRNWYYPFHSIGKNVSFHHTSKVCCARASRISLGNSVSLKEYAWLNVATNVPTGEPIIVIEDNCKIGFGSILSAKNKIYVERDVLFGQMVLVLDHNHAYEDIAIPVLDQGVTEGGRIRIGRGTWIGHGACIICSRGELTIGRNCVVAANSTVLQSVPDYAVVSGSPARVIRQFDCTRGAWVIGAMAGMSPVSVPGQFYGRFGLLNEDSISTQDVL